MNRRRSLAILAVIVIAAIVYFASPYLAVHNFVDSARSGDAARLEAAVDFPAVRESLKSQFNAYFVSEMQNDPKMANNPFAGLGVALAPAIVDKMVDGYVTPDGIAAMVRRGRASAAGDQPAQADAPAAESNSAPKAELNWRSLDLVEANIRRQDQPEPLKMFFERRGVVKWLLVRVEVPFPAKPNAG